MPVELPDPARTSVRPLSAPIPVPTPPEAERTGPWTPQTLASAGDSTGAHRPLIPLAPGQTPHVPGYELLGILGRGGMGVVYQARQTKLNRIVALKMILGDRSEPKDLIRFLAEAEAVAVVRHPHVVQVYEYGDADGQPFLALEYLPGGSLADHLRFRGRMVPEAAAEVVRKLAIGIQAVHDHGIVHRDLKPANVLFDETGEPKVADFGLAKRDDHNDLTARDAVMGTPAFMSPEQAAGGTKFVGPAADIYSLGVILYVCLTGKRPFEDTDPISLLRKVVETDPDKPRKHVPTLPRDVELICLKCLAKVPHERYLTAKALADDLSNFSGGRPVSVRPARLVERGVKWARRKPVVAAAYGLTAISVLLVGLVAGAVWLWQQAEGAKGQAEQATKGAEVARDGEKDARGIAETERKTAEGARDREEIARKNEETARIQADDLANKLSASAGWIQAIDFGPDGTRVVTGDIKTARVWDAKTGKQLFALDTRGPVVRVQFSSDGRILTKCADEAVFRFSDATTGKPLNHILPETGPTLDAMLTPDGKRIVALDAIGRLIIVGADGKLITSFAAFDSKFKVNGMTMCPDGKKVCAGLGIGSDWGGKVWDLDSGKQTVSWKARLVYSVAWSGDGKWIASAEDHKVVVRNAANGEPNKTLMTPTNTHAARVAITHDGDRVAAFCFDGVVRMWEVGTGQVVASYELGAVGKGNVVFSPDGHRLAASRPGGMKIWDLARSGQPQPPAAVPPNVVGPNPLKLPAHSGPVLAIGFNRDCTRLVTGDSTSARVWDAASGKELIKLVTPTPVTRAWFDDSNRILTACSTESAARLYTVEGKPLGFLKSKDGGLPREAMFTPDGKRIVTTHSTGIMTVFDAEKQTIIKSISAFDAKQVQNGMAISPDGKRVCSAVGKGSEWFIKIWDLEVGTEVKSWLASDKPEWSVAWSVDGKWIVSGGVDQKVKVWDADTGKLFKTLAGPERTVARVAINREGNRIAATCFDGIVRVWDPKTGTLVKTFNMEATGTGNVAFSPDGKRLAASAPGVVRIFNLHE